MLRGLERRMGRKTAVCRGVEGNLACKEGAAWCSGRGVCGVWGQTQMEAGITATGGLRSELTGAARTQTGVCDESPLTSLCSAPSSQATTATPLHAHTLWEEEVPSLGYQLLSAHQGPYSSQGVGLSEHCLGDHIPGTSTFFSIRFGFYCTRALCAH